MLAYYASVMAALSEAELGAIAQFKELEQRSSTLYVELRDVADGGSAWLVYFGRAFDAYSRLWSLQRGVHRRLLVEHGGLTRWRIGEIASRIGQLYYQYYLRTSDLAHLQQASTFYDIIVSRNYFHPRERPTDVDPKDHGRRLLRFHARCLVVHLLMGNHAAAVAARDRMEKATQRSAEMMPQSLSRGPWLTTLREATQFLDCLQRVSISDADGNTGYPPLCNRVPRRSAASSRASLHRLEHAVLVGCRQRQVKVTPLSLDMFFVQQCCERKPPPLRDAAGVPIPVAFRKAADGSDENPKKQLLYQPTLPKLLSGLAMAVEESGANGCVMLYVAADTSSSGNVQGLQVPAAGRDRGGPAGGGGGGGELSDGSALLLPADLEPFLRKPMLIVLDCPAADGSFAVSRLSWQDGECSFHLAFPPRCPPARQANPASWGRSSPALPEPAPSQWLSWRAKCKWRARTPDPTNVDCLRVSCKVMPARSSSAPFTGLPVVNAHTRVWSCQIPLRPFATCVTLPRFPVTAGRFCAAWHEPVDGRCNGNSAHYPETVSLTRHHPVAIARRTASEAVDRCLRTMEERLRTVVMDGEQPLPRVCHSRSN